MFYCDPIGPKIVACTQEIRKIDEKKNIILKPAKRNRAKDNDEMPLVSQNRYSGTNNIKGIFYMLHAFCCFLLFLVRGFAYSRVVH